MLIGEWRSEVCSSDLCDTGKWDRLRQYRGIVTDFSNPLSYYMIYRFDSVIDKNQVIHPVRYFNIGKHSQRIYLHFIDIHHALLFKCSCFRYHWYNLVSLWDPNGAAVSIRQNTFGIRDSRPEINCYGSRMSLSGNRFHVAQLGRTACREGGVKESK